MVLYLDKKVRVERSKQLERDFSRRHLPTKIVIGKIIKSSRANFTGKLQIRTIANYQKRKASLENLKL